MRIEHWAALCGLLRRAPRSDVAALVVVTALCALTEGMGIMLLVPLLQAVGAGGGSAAAWLPAMLGRLDPAASLGLVLAIFVGLVGARAALQHVQVWLSSRLQHRITDALRRECYAALLAAEWRWLAKRRASDHASMLITGVGRVGFGLHQCLYLLASLLALGVYAAALLALSWQMAALAAAVGALVLVLLAGLRKAALASGVALGRVLRGLDACVHDTLAGLRMIKIYGNEARHAATFDAALADLRDQQVGYAMRSSLTRVATQVTGAGLLAMLTYVGLVHWQVGAANMLALAVVLVRLLPMLGSCQQTFQHWLNAVPAVVDIERLIGECAAAAEPAAEPAASRILLSDAIVLDGITVQFADRDAPALDRLSLRIGARTTTVVTGASGSGKSTLADVLTGLIEPGSGTVTIDRLSLAGSVRRQWRRSVAYVTQSTFLFNDTIRNNLLWADPGATQAELERALEQAAASFVYALPGGLDTSIGDGGCTLSGGERQRIALARALLGKRQLIVLDEVTSALDTDNEAAVLGAVAALRGEVTLVVVTHRPAAIEGADLVVELERGRLLTAKARTELAA